MSLTPYDDVNAFVLVLLDRVQSIFGGHFVGLYLFGSLAIGDFDPGRSDIDFLVVTTVVLPDSSISKLKTMHSRLQESSLRWATRLEGAYMPLDAIRTENPDGPRCALVHINDVFDKNEFVVVRPESNWVINRHVLRTKGLVAAGPSPRTIIDPVPSAKLKQAVLTMLHNNWTSWLQNIDLLYHPGHQPFAVLTMCRSLYILKYGTVTSKKRSAEWVKKTGRGRWAPLIDCALAWYPGDPPGDVTETQEFIKYVFNRVCH